MASLAISGESRDLSLVKLHPRNGLSVTDLASHSTSPGSLQLHVGLASGKSHLSLCG